MCLLIICYDFFAQIIKITFAPVMMNQDFKYNLKLALTGEIPGWKAHLKLAPLERIKGIQEQNNPSDTKQSAVLIVLFQENKKIKVLFILRSIYDGVHSGQISFPGGQKEESDKSLADTALRETFEEVGIKIDPKNILGKLSNLYIPPSNFIVEPFVAYVENLDEFVIDESEVQHIYKIELKELLDAKAIQVKDVLSRNNQTISAPCFYINELKIWGATAMIFNELMEIIKSNGLAKIIP